MSFRYDIRLSGSGGQGLIMMGIILAEAAGVYDGKEVAQTQSYGPEARGGSSKAEVIVSDEEIDYPKALKLDLLLAMSQKALDEYCQDLKPDGLLIVDSTFVKTLPVTCPVAHAVRVPFTRLARDHLKIEMVANIVALGAISELSSVVSRKAVEAALLARVPKGTEKLNRDALKAGIAAAKRVRKSGPAPEPGAWENEDL
jgi:2-oxoglutarate ferredoxin oxidoreductase subunit gamma